MRSMCSSFTWENNEVVGIHGPNPGSPPWAQSLALIRAGHWVRTTKLGQLLSNALGSSSERRPQDMAYFRAHRLPADDPRRDKNRENFRENLEEILQNARTSGAKVILCTVADEPQRLSAACILASPRSYF
jgi:hypothetical protein